MLDRKLAPPFQETVSITLPTPLEIKLSTGLPIFLLQGLQQNVAKIEVIFSSGKWFESKTGLAQFTASLLEKGTETRTAEEIAGTLDYYGASLEIQPGFDFVSISLYALRNQWSNVFPVFLEILKNPSFPEKEWQLMRDIFLQTLKVNNEKTSFRASALIRKSIFGATHPYGSSVEEKEVEALTIADFHSYFRTTFNVHSIYGVGNFSPEELAVMKTGFESLLYRHVSTLAPLSPSGEPSIEYVPKEGSSQSSIRLGKRSLLKSDPDYFDLQLLNHLLGGFFGSRLMKNIREEKGLTYGIYSSTNTFMHDSLFMIGADVNKVNLEFAIREIRHEVEKLRDHAVDPQELRLAKNHFVGSLQTDMANLFSVIEKIKSIHLQKLPPTYYQHLFDRMNQIVPEDMIRVAQKYFPNDSLFEVAVG